MEFSSWTPFTPSSARSHLNAFARRDDSTPRGDVRQASANRPSGDVPNLAHQSLPAASRGSDPIIGCALLFRTLLQRFLDAGDQSREAIGFKAASKDRIGAEQLIDACNAIREQLLPIVTDLQHTSPGACEYKKCAIMLSAKVEAFLSAFTAGRMQAPAVAGDPRDVVDLIIETKAAIDLLLQDMLSASSSAA